MKRTKASRRLTMMIVIGLGFTSGSSLLGRYMHLPDFVLGIISGVGIAIMILGLVWERRGRACMGERQMDR